MSARRRTRTPVAPSPARDCVVHRLRQRLLDGSLPGDSPLPTVRALARRENVSQATVQEAYWQLEAQGLVETRSRIGRFPVPLSPKQRRQKAIAALREAVRQPVADALDAGLSRTMVRKELQRLLGPLEAPRRTS